jgi:DNA helicase-2/ATP-dependent DNA helicase PcrA
MFDVPAHAYDESMNEYPYLEMLNEPQRQAVTCIQGPLLVLAGAGTGKTRVLTTRIAHLIQAHHISAKRILAVTFTNKAAQEMKERVAKALDEPVEGLWLGTFHSLSLRILRQYGELVGLQNGFSIIDMEDQIKIIKELIKINNIDDKRMPARMIATLISRFKDKALSPEKALAAHPEQRKIIDLYQQYDDRLSFLNAADFGDLLLKCLTLFQENPSVLQRFHDQFDYILVDEYQDTNVAQYLWLRLLAQSHHNICCVGDDDQSIYGWRGAEVGNILRFEKDFPNAQVVRLEENYRSTGHILDAASALIAKNTKRLGKTLWTSGVKGEKILIKGCEDSYAEARFICHEIQKGMQQGVPLRSFALLVRAGYQTREFEERLLQMGIHYKIIGGMRFFERAEIKDAIAYFRLSVQPHDNIAFERVINAPKRGLGPSALSKIHIHAREHGFSLYQSAWNLMEQGGIRGQAGGQLATFLQQIEHWHKRCDKDNHVDLAKDILDASGYTQIYLKVKSQENQARLENIKELIKALEDFSSFNEFLEHVSLVSESSNRQSDDAVSLMTLHAAKGLEFPFVFLPGFEEGIFPSQRSIEENGLEGLEEERRLAYVGLTRAREKACITFAGRRRTYQGWQNTLPSRFLKDIPDHCAKRILVQNHTHSPSTGSFYGSASSSSPWQDNDFRQDTPQASVQIAQLPSRNVTHTLFGKGQLLSLDGDSCYVNFEKYGKKTVMRSFLKFC